MHEPRLATEPYRFTPPSAIQLVVIQIVCLSAAAMIAVGALAVSIIHLFASGASADWIGLKLNPLIASVGCGASLAFSMASPTKSHVVSSRILACAAAISALFDLLKWFQGSTINIASFIDPDRTQALVGAMPPFVAAAFVLLAVLLCIIRRSGGMISAVADCIAFFLGLLALSMVAGWLFRVMHVFNTVSVNRTPPAALCILALLILVAFTVRARYGLFDILVGTGIGSRIARGVAPVVLVLAFFREAGRARIVGFHLLPEQSAAAILGSAAGMAALAIVVVVARHIRSMEQEIHQLSLRDELTGLYNLRGFRLLAEQSIRLAYRSQTPYSVLFVDLDHLKQINDTLGHAAGSAVLVETAELLNVTFRESDVIARIGGDEFAVAGQFSESGISKAAERLKESASLTRIEGSAGKTLSLSVGYATDNEPLPSSLQDLLDQADVAMYEDKKGRKHQTWGGGKTSRQA